MNSILGVLASYAAAKYELGDWMQPNGTLRFPDVQRDTLSLYCLHDRSEGVYYCLFLTESSETARAFVNPSGRSFQLGTHSCHLLRQYCGDTQLER